MFRNRHELVKLFIAFFIIVLVICSFGETSKDFDLKVFEDKLRFFLNTENLPTESSFESLAACVYGMFFLYNQRFDPRFREEGREVLEEIFEVLPDAVYQILKGMEKWAYDGYPLSKEHFLEAVENVPQSWWTNLQMMFYNYEIWRRTESADYMRETLKYAEKVIDDRSDVAYAYLVEMDVFSGDRYKDPERLYDIYNAALKRVADSPVFWRESLKIFYRLGDHESAINSALRLAELGRMDDESRFMLAQSWWHMGEKEKAYNALLETNLKVIKAEWRSQAYNMMGSVEEERGNLERAIEFYSQAIRADKNNVTAFKRLGLAYLKTDLERKDTYARYYLGIAQKLNPRDEEVNTALSELQRRIMVRVLLTIFLPILAVIIGLLILVEKLLRPKERLDV